MATNTGLEASLSPLIAQESATPAWMGSLIASGVVVLAVVLAYMVVVRVGHRLADRVGRRDEESAARARTLWIVSRRVILVVLVVTAGLLVLVIWEINITPFLAVGTVLGAAIGFGAQNLIKDLISGFFILVEDQFHVGDVVSVAGASGVVEDIQFRVTVLRDLEGNRHYVPNGEITVTTNYTDEFARPLIDVGVAYGTDIGHALEVMLDELRILGEDPDWTDRITGEPEMFGVEKLDDSAVLLRARLMTLPLERWNVRREALKRLKRRFDAEGITIPFPQLTIHKGE